MLIHVKIWVQSLSTGVRFLVSNVLFSNIKFVAGEGGYRFPPGGDLLRRSFKQRQTTLVAILCTVPTTFGNDCRCPRVLLSVVKKITVSDVEI